VKFDESSLQVQGTPVPLVEGIRVEGGGAVQYSIGRDGTLMYIAGANNNSSHLVWVDRSGTEVPLGVPPRTFYSVRLNSASQVAALDVRDSGTDGADIWVLPLGRQSPTRVTFDPADDSLPVWMPDGRLVFTSARDRIGTLFSQPANGTGTAEPLASRSDTTKLDAVLVDQAAVSPDGQFVVARSSGEDIVLVSVADKTVRKLIESPFRERNPDISRDGRWIAYQSDESGSFEVYVRPFPDVGKGKWPVSDQGGTRPVWAHNRTELFYLGLDSTLMSVTFDASGSLFTPATPKRVVTLPLTPGSHRAFDVSADDQRFLTAKGETSNDRAEINVVKDWFEELKKKVPVK
jgi:serine/threonine-protein kinase